MCKAAKILQAVLEIRTFRMTSHICSSRIDELGLVIGMAALTLRHLSLLKMILFSVILTLF